MVERRGFLLSAAAAALVGCGADVAESKTGRRRMLHSMAAYKGAGLDGMARLPAFETWLGRRLTHAIDFFAYKDWDDVISSGRWISKSWAGGRWKHLSLAVPMLPSTHVGELAAGARGEFDDRFREIARFLVADGHADAVIRLGWEFNGDWTPWAAGRDPEAWKAYWRRIVDVMRSVEGSKLRFDWCSTLGRKAMATELCWPGDDVVDIVGTDVYNEVWSPAQKVAEFRWLSNRDGENGLAWQREFARQHGKPVSFPEWGTGFKPGDHGGGDDAYFIEQMAAWLADSNLAYHGYWDYPAPDYNAMLSAGEDKPQASKAFRQLFGGRA